MNEAEIDRRSPYVKIRKRIGRRMLIAFLLINSSFFAAAMMPFEPQVVNVTVLFLFLLGAGVALSSLLLYACPICRYPLYLGEHLRGPGISKICTNCKTDLTKPLSNDRKSSEGT